MEKNCQQCNKVMEKKISYSQSYWDGSKFCSRACQHISYKGISFSSKSQFKKGDKRSKKDEQYRISKLREVIVGEKHHKWVGDKVKYTSVHHWIQRWKGVPSLCEMCGTIKAKRFEWANIDHTYKRVLEDYIRMCTKCHRHYDYSNGLCDIGSRYGSIPNKTKM